MKPRKFELGGAEKLSDDGVIEFAQMFLITTYKDYKKSLKTVMELKSDYKKFFKIVAKYDDYMDIKKSLKAIKRKKPANRKPEEIEFYNKYKFIKCPNKPTKYQLEIVRQYVNARSTKGDCERFYRSQRFQIWTLGADVDPELVISRAREEVNYIEKGKL